MEKPPKMMFGQVPIGVLFKIHPDATAAVFTNHRKQRRGFVYRKVSSFYATSTSFSGRVQFRTDFPVFTRKESSADSATTSSAT